MPHYRQLYIKTVDSFDFNDMPDDFTRVVWLLLPLILDREGRGIANTAWIKSRMFPLRVDVTLDQISSAFEWLADRKMIIHYSINGHNYFYVPTFKQYQKHTERETPSVLPAPEFQPQYAGTTQELLMTNSRVSQELVENNSTAYESESVNESESVLNLNEKKFFEFRGPEKVLLRVTGFAALPSTFNPYLEKVLDLLQHFGWVETLARLNRSWDAWCNSKRKDNGKPYSRTNPNWIDNAIAEMQPETEEDLEAKKAAEYQKEVDRILEATKYQR